jgi:hypothetical protein
LSGWKPIGGLSPESSRELGPFHFSRAPYLIEPQKAILDPDVREVVLNWSSQCGKSELWLNALLYWSVNSPAPALVVAPDWKSCKSLSRRIKPMARDAAIGWDYDKIREEQQLGGPWGRQFRISNHVEWSDVLPPKKRTRNSRFLSCVIEGIG